MTGKITSMEEAIRAISDASGPTALKPLIDAGFLQMETVKFSRIGQEETAIGTEFKIPMLIYADVDEIKLLRKSLAALADKGIITAVDAELFQAMKADSVATARATIKQLTTHNDKLGIDWSKISDGPVASYSEQF